MDSIHTFWCWKEDENSLSDEDILWIDDKCLPIISDEKWVHCARVRVLYFLFLPKKGPKFSIRSSYKERCVGCFKTHKLLNNFYGTTRGPAINFNSNEREPYTSRQITFYDKMLNCFRIWTALSLNQQFLCCREYL